MKKKILIVEDEAIVAERVRRVLEREGYEVVGIAFTMEEAVELAEEKFPDIAIIDVVLKKGDGIKAAEKIMKELKIPVIFMTAYSDTEILEKALKTQPYAYILKPFEEKQLLGLVKVSLARVESERKLEKLKRLFEFLNLSRERIMKTQDVREIALRLCHEVAPRFFKYCGLMLFEQNQPKHWETELGKFKDEFEAAIKDGKLPQCIIQGGDEVEFLRDRREICKQCPLKKICGESGALLLRFRGKENLHGAMFLAPPGDWEDEEILRYLKGFSQDISLSLESINIEKERKQALLSLENYLSFLKALFSSMKEMVFAFDENMNLTFVHSPEEGFLIKEKEKIIGKKPHGLLPPEIAENFQKAFEENRKGKVQYYEYELEMGGKKRWFAVSQSPLIMGDKFAGALAIVRDITAKKELEIQLRERERKYRTLFENVPVGIYRTTPEGRIVEANPAFIKILGYDKEEIERMNASRLFLNPRQREAWRNRLEEKGVLEGEYQLKRKDGKIIWVRDVARVSHQHGKTFYEGAIQDISEIKEKEQELSKSILKLRRLFGETVTALGAMVEMKDPYTSGHQIRVAQLAVAIAMEMGFKGEDLEFMRVAGLLHDIGKLAIPSEILVKPGKLLPQEMELVKLHPGISYDILSQIDFPWPVADVVLQHHERPDGSGYPRGLKGHEIMKEAKILAVADVVESISSHRPYRPALGIDKALEEIKRGRGTLYDAAVVDATLRVFERGFRFETSSFTPGRPINNRRPL